MPSSRSANYGSKFQHGGAMLVMLVILVMGITTAFVTSLSNVGLANQRNQITSNSLAIAKEALIGRAVSDDNLPGSLPCPDTNNDGVAELFSGSACPNYLGRLPWKSLGISDLRDGSGERLWYALTPSFRDQTPTPHSLNSETTGSISLSGNVSDNNLIAIVFAPGATLSGQSRITANENDYAHYLESVVTPATSFLLQTMDNHAGGSYTYNDQIIYLDHDSVMHPVEWRIAKEVQHCLDVYAASNPKNNYPWPAKTSINNYVSYYNSPNLLFGRIPTHPNVFTTDSEALQFINYLNTLQVALNNYTNEITTDTQLALYNAGRDLKNFADDVGAPISSDAAGKAEDAGSRAKDLAYPPTSYSISNVQSKIDSTLSELIGDNIVSHASTSPYSMPTYWPNCPLLSDTSSDAYWPFWRSQIFYEIDNDCRPYFSTNCATSGSLHIDGDGNTSAGSGTYRAVVLLSRTAVGGQSRSSPSASNYLEGSNIQNETDMTPNHFISYKPSNASFAANNDLVLCLDGNVNCM